jgi:hypothetical protein
VLFERRLRDGIRDGSITVAFRRWKRRQVVAGGRYRTGEGLVEVESVARVNVARITDRDARRAGFRSAADLRADLGTGDAPVYRLALRRVEGPDPRDTLAATDLLDDADLAELDRRLDRLDSSGGRGPWTAAVLAAIAARPGVRAADLATSLGWEELQPFKLSVRKLKALGLTVSLEVSYRLSPRSEAYLATTRHRPEEFPWRPRGA